jgi:hypothetical protein
LKAKKAAQKEAKRAALLAAGTQPAVETKDAQKAAGPDMTKLKLTKAVFKPSFAPE